MLFLWFAMAQANPLCSDTSVELQKTLQIVQEKLSTEDCTSTLNALHTVNSLNLSQAGISNIQPLKEAKQLRVLIISHNQIEDLSPLASLSLRWLDISYNPISDIAPLAAMHDLETLWASHMRLTHLFPIQGLQNIRYMSFEYNTIEDISSFHSIQTIEFLGLAQNEIKDFRVLESNTNLRFFSLKGNPVVHCPEKKGVLRNICQKELER